MDIIDLTEKDEDYVSQAEAARLLSVQRKRSVSRSRINQYTKHPEHSKNIRMRGTLVNKYDILSLPSRKKFVGRPEK